MQISPPLQSVILFPASYAWYWAQVEAEVWPRNTTQLCLRTAHYYVINQCYVNCWIIKTERDQQDSIVKRELLIDTGSEEVQMHKEAAKADGSDSSVSIALLPLSQRIFLASQRIPRTSSWGRKNTWAWLTDTPAWDTGTRQGWMLLHYSCT